MEAGTKEIRGVGPTELAAVGQPRKIGAIFVAFSEGCGGPSAGLAPDRYNDDQPWKIFAISRLLLEQVPF